MLSFQEVLSVTLLARLPFEAEEKGNKKATQLGPDLIPQTSHLECAAKQHTCFTSLVSLANNRECVGGAGSSDRHPLP